MPDQTDQPMATPRTIARESTEPAPRPPRSAFSDDFVRRLATLEDPATALEAELSGAWRVEAQRDGTYALFRDWEDGEAGDLPRWSFTDPAFAELAAVALPLANLSQRYRLSGRVTGEGYELEVEGRPCGRSRTYDPDFVQAIGLVDQLVRRPEALAALLEAAGPSALELIGRRLCRGVDRVVGQEESPEPPPEAAPTAR